MRHNDMRRSLLVVTAVLALAAAGCSGPAGSAGPTSAGTPPTAGGAASGPAGGRPLESSAAPTSPASAPTADPGRRRPSPAPTASRTTPPADPENPNDQVGAPIVLTGTVHTSGTCVTLTVGAHRWALVGASTGALRQGQTVTVRGRPVALAAGCRADFALAVRDLR
jgi:hypothetical protein